MKIEDIAKELANRVNQEHYILQYLEKIERGAYNKGYEEGFKDAESQGIKEAHKYQ